MRIIICGGRDYGDRRHFNKVVENLDLERGPITMIIHGACKTGADWMAGHWARTHADSVMEAAVPADWETYGKAAGPIRNQKMIDDGKPELVLAFPGGRGTADMVRRAKRAGVEVIEVTA